MLRLVAIMAWFFSSLFLSSWCFALPADSPERFFVDPDMVSARLNPNGSAIAAIDYRDGAQRLVLINVPANPIGQKVLTQRKVLLDVAKFTENEASLRAIDWVDNRHIAVVFSQIKKGIKDLVDTRRSNYILIVKVPEANEPVEISSVRTRGAMVDSLPSEDDFILFSKRGAYSKVYKLRVSLLNQYKQKASKLTKTDGGQFTKANEIASINGYATRWFINNAGDVIAVLNYDKDSNLVLNAFSAAQSDAQGAKKKSDSAKEDNKKQLKKWSKKELQFESNAVNLDDINANGKARQMIIPIALADSDNSFYCFDYAEEEQRSVYKVNYLSGEQELVYESDSYRIVDIIQARETGKLIGVSVLKDGELRHVYLQQQMVQSKTFKPGEYLSLIGESVDKRIQLVYSQSHNSPGRYSLVTLANDSWFTVGRVFPGLADVLPSKLVQGSVNVEGLDIPYLLSLPTSQAKRALPLIVFPHGGPIGVFDSPFFDSTIQFFNANGYAVLQVNYRGSSGHSQALKEAGKKQWGNLILTDIHNAAEQVVARDDIDNGKVCLFGTSYGGYASAMLLIRHPEFYRCGVNVAGVSDINLFLNSAYMTARQTVWSREYIGDPLHSYDEFKAQSPVYNADRLIRPLLIMHGEKDKVVSVEHAYRFKKALELYDKSFEWYVFPEMGHSVDDHEQSIRLYGEAIQFIKKHTLN